MLFRSLGNFSAATYLPLWLYITNARDGRVTVSVLGTDNAKSDTKAWPDALIRFYRGELSEEEVRKAAASADASTERGRRCEADFYIGEWRLLQHDKDAARLLFQRAAAECPHNFIEYEMLAVELKRLETQAALQ